MSVLPKEAVVIYERREKMKDVSLKLSNEDYRKIKWIADKLGLGVNATLRSLIPNIQFPEAKFVKEKHVSRADGHDLVPVVQPLNRDLLDKHLDVLLEKGWAKTLAKEIKQQLIDKEGAHLTVNTYKRLSRWINPYRQTEREKYVQPKAEAISKLLFGHPIDRVNT